MLSRVYFCSPGKITEILHLILFGTFKNWLALEDRDN